MKARYVLVVVMVVERSERRPKLINETNVLKVKMQLCVDRSSNDQTH